MWAIHHLRFYLQSISLPRICNKLNSQSQGLNIFNRMNWMNEICSAISWKTQWERSWWTKLKDTGRVACFTYQYSVVRVYLAGQRRLQLIILVPHKRCRFNSTTSIYKGDTAPSEPSPTEPCSIYSRCPHEYLIQLYQRFSTWTITLSSSFITS